jgi:hypothetical protein
MPFITLFAGGLLLCVRSQGRLGLVKPESLSKFTELDGDVYMSTGLRYITGQ